MEKQEIDLNNPEFRQVESLLNYTDVSVFMTGKAGTGKSTFLKHITRTTRKKHVVLAPTGIAAVNAGGQTLHSFFHIPLKPLLAEDPEFDESRLSNRMKYTKRFIKMLRELELIIIDEISMVRADVIDFIDKILRHYCRKKAHLPFGGKQILMVGDVFQLEPVVNAQTREILRREYSSFYFFSAKVFSQIDLVPIELRKVYRQNNAEFIDLLDRVRSGHPTPADIKAINSRVANTTLNEDKGSMAMTIATRRDIVDFINESHLESLPGSAHKFTATVEGDFPESSFPTDRELVLKEGAQVVFIRNDPERRWVNGTIGKVTDITQSAIEVTTENGNIFDLEPEIWNNIEYGFDEKTKAVTENVKGAFKQFPVKLAWALTIHKSQGLTFNKITIDVGQGAFTGGQSYVALSRCTSLEGITMATPIRQSDIYVSRDVLNFATNFNNASLVTSALESARADSLYADAATAFNEGNFSDAVRVFAEASQLRQAWTAPRYQRLIAMKLHSLNPPNRRIKQLESKIKEQQATLNRLADEYVQLGVLCLESGEKKAAKANFTKALSLNPENKKANRLLKKLKNKSDS